MHIIPRVLTEEVYDLKAEFRCNKCNRITHESKLVSYMNFQSMMWYLSHYRCACGGVTILTTASYIPGVGF